MASAQTVVWVSDNKSGAKLDQEWLDIMVRSGYQVNQEFSEKQGRVLNAAKIEKLNAADLIIISRDNNSADYAGDEAEIQQWNSIETPLILMNAWLARNNRWRWLDSESAIKIGAALPNMVIALGQDNHPIFKGFGFNDDYYTISLLTGSQSFLATQDVGSGTVLSYHEDNGWPWIALWEPGVEFYEGAGQTPAARRLYFCAGLDNPDGEVNVTRDGLVMFLNAADFMIGKSNPYPTLPDPDVNVILEELKPTLLWRSGALADTHQVYFSEDREAVEGLAVEALIATTDKAELALGTPEGPLSDGLTPGTTYYWRSVEVAEGDPNGPWAGALWNFMVRPLTAWHPTPANQMLWVDPAQQMLTWERGMLAVEHQVYFSTDQQAVTDGAASALKGATPDLNWVLDGLVEKTTYYWRVDEIQADGTVINGAVWQFTTVDSGSVEGLLGNYFPNRTLFGDAVLTRTDPSINFDWSINGPVGIANYSVRWNGEIVAPFTDTYRIIGFADDAMRIYIDGQLVASTWQKILGVGATVDVSGFVDMEAGKSYSIQMEYYQTTGGASAELAWASDNLVRMTIPAGALLLPQRAYNPAPGMEAVDVDQHPILSWDVPEKVTGHDVYFGTDRDAVANATVDTAGIYLGRQTDASLTPDALAWNQTYYWRIDGVTAGNVVKGTIWSFTTAGFAGIDDFESYADVEGRWVFNTWLDGYGGNIDLGGSTVGHASTTMETTYVQGGSQALPLYYDNDGSFTDYFGASSTPIASETTREFATAQDWTTRDGVSLKTLRLWFMGDFDIVDGATLNVPDDLYLKVEDAAGTVVTIPHPDNPASVNVTGYTEWVIPLSDLASQNIDLTQVKKMTIGVGQTEGSPRGTGLLFIDSVALWPDVSDETAQ